MIKVSYFTVTHYDDDGQEVKNFEVWNRINSELEIRNIDAENIINIKETDAYTRVFFRFPPTQQWSADLSDIIT